MSRTNADLTLDLLTAAGVDRVFTCPGTTEVPLLDAAVRRESPRFVLTTHETTAVSAADAYARATGKIGVALLHANVGLTNGLAMVEAAKLGRSRVLVLNGTKPMSNRNRRGFTQTPESPPVARHFAVQATSLATEASLPDDIAQALQRLHQHPQGPVYLELPQDLLAAETQRQAEPTYSTPATAPATVAIEGAAATLTQSDKVAVVAGSDLGPAGTKKLVALAETLEAPIFEAPWRELERDTVATDHPSYAGVLSYSASLLEDATVLVAGTPTFQEPDAGVGLLSESADVIHLLAESSELTPGALPLVGEYAPALTQLALAIGEDDKAPCAAYREQAIAQHRQQIAALSESARSGPLSVTALAKEIGSRPLSGPIVLDAVTASAAMLQLIPRGPAQEFFATGSGALGWGPGAAVGVALAGTHQRVYGVVSDGVLQFGIQALHTAVAEQLPITYIVVNNEAYHAVTLALQKFNGAARAADQYPCTHLGDTDLSVVSQGFGLRSARVTSRDELRSALAEFDTHQGPALVEAMVTTTGAGNTSR